MKTFNTSRDIPSTPAHVFTAMSDSTRLGRWWGPAGFTNTIEVCEFKNGGRWILTMHGPDGTNYPNEYKFLEIITNKKVIVSHIQEPKFTLTIELSPSAKGTLVTWSQAFENSEIASRIEHIVVPANEQNLDRLSDEVKSSKS